MLRLRYTVNGEERRGVAEPRTLLADFLRHELGLTVGADGVGLNGAAGGLADGSAWSGTGGEPTGGPASAVTGETAGIDHSTRCANTCTPSSGASICT